MIRERLAAMWAVMALIATTHVQLAKRKVEYGFLLGDYVDDQITEWTERHVGGRLREAGAGTRTVRAAQGLSDQLLTFVVVGIVILLGILIYSEVQTAIPTPSNADLSNASSNATTTFSDSMELAPLVILVGVAALILAVVQRFR